MLNPLTQRRILKRGIAGTAEVLHLAYQYGQSSLSNRQLTLRVQVPGMDPYEVDGQWMVRGKYVDDLRRGSQIPVKVDPDDPSQVAIDWDRLAHPDPVDITFTAPPQVTVYQQAVAEAGTDDRISKLEALAELRDSGALTEAEFAAAKAKILGGQ